jgi:hypothetical protein
MPRTIVNPGEAGAPVSQPPRVMKKRGGAAVPAPPATGVSLPPPPPPPPSPPPADGYNDRVLKYIPAEVVTLYLSIDGLVRAKHSSPGLSWGLFVFGLLATVLYLRFSAGVTKPLQIVVSAVAFCVWAISIGSPSTYIPGYDAVYGAIALPIFTFLAGLIKP